MSCYSSGAIASASRIQNQSKKKVNQIFNWLILGKKYHFQESKDSNLHLHSLIEISLSTSSENVSIGRHNISPVITELLDFVSIHPKKSWTNSINTPIDKKIGYVMPTWN